MSNDGHRKIINHMSIYIRLLLTAVLLRVSACVGPPKLHLAIYDGDVQSVRTLLGGGADINEPGGYSPPDLLNQTPLMLASTRGEEEIVRTLLANGATVDLESDASLPVLIPGETRSLNSKPIGSTALWNASALGHAGVVQILLDAGASVRGEMHGAARMGRENVLNVILASGIDVNHLTEPENFTALMIGSHNGQVEVVKVLLAAGASVHLKDSKGRTALSLTMLKFGMVTYTAPGGTSKDTKICIPSANEVIFDLLIEAGAQPKEFGEVLYATGNRLRPRPLPRQSSGQTTIIGASMQTTGLYASYVWIDIACQGVQ